jgi:hypothetical protein
LKLHIPQSTLADAIFRLAWLHLAKRAHDDARPRGWRATSLSNASKEASVLA